MSACFLLCSLGRKEGALPCTRGCNCVAFWCDTNVFSSLASRWQSCIPEIFMALNFPVFHISRFASLDLSVSLLFVWFPSTFAPAPQFHHPERSLFPFSHFLCCTYCNLQGANLIISLVTTYAAGRVTRQKVWAFFGGGGGTSKRGHFLITKQPWLLHHFNLAIYLQEVIRFLVLNPL